MKLFLRGFFLLFTCSLYGYLHSAMVTSTSPIASKKVIGQQGVFTFSKVRVNQSVQNERMQIQAAKQSAVENIIGNVSKFVGESMRCVQDLFKRVVNLFMSDWRPFFEAADYYDHGTFVIMIPLSTASSASDVSLEQPPIPVVQGSQPTSPDQLYYPFGYGGAGSLGHGFSGLKAHVKADKMPPFLVDPFEGTLRKLKIRDLIDVEPHSEFLLKACMAYQNQSKNMFSMEQLIAEYGFLLLRMRITPQIQSIDMIFEKSPKVINFVTNTMMIGSYSFKDFLLRYDGFLGRILQDTSLTQSTPMTAQDIVKTLLAISLKTFQKFDKGWDAFVPSQAGQQLSHGLEQKQKEFLKKLIPKIPGYSQMTNELKSAILVPLQKSGYGTNVQQADLALAGILNPFLGHALLNWDMIKPDSNLISTASANQQQDFKIDLLMLVTSADVAKVDMPKVDVPKVSVPNVPKISAPKVTVPSIPKVSESDGW